MKYLLLISLIFTITLNKLQAQKGYNFSKLGDSCVNIGDIATAEKYYQEALIANINDIKSRNNLIKCQTILYPTYIHKGSYKEGMAKVSIPNKWGFIDANKKLAIPIEFDDVQDFSEGLAPVMKGYHWGYINQEGKITIPLIYTSASEFTNGLAMVGQKSKTGFIDKSGKVVIPLIFNSIWDFSGRNFTAAQKENKWGVIDRSGKVVIPFEYDEITPSFNDKKTMTARKDKKSGHLDLTTGQFKIDLNFEKVWDFREGLAAVSINKKWGFINDKKELIIPLIFDEVTSFYNEISAVKIENSWDYINKKGKFITNMKFDKAFSFTSTPLALVLKNKKWGYIDPVGNIKIPLQYDMASIFQESYAAVSKDGKWGYINSTGTEVIPMKFDEARSFDSGLAVVKQNNKYGYLNYQGKITIPIEYDAAYGFYPDGTALVQKGSDLFYINKQGVCVKSCPNK